MKYIMVNYDKLTAIIAWNNDLILKHEDPLLYLILRYLLGCSIPRMLLST